MSKALAPIKRWTVQHERVIHLHIVQKSASEIAEDTGLTITRVSQIIVDPKGQEIIAGFIAKMREATLINLDDGLITLAVKGMERIAETMNAEFPLGGDAKKHQDRLGLDLIKLIKGDVTNQTEVERPLDAGMSKRLIVALEASVEVDRIIQETKEASFTEVES
ncbi:MAG: hypothetical protein V3T23_10190 [Nitrososphaerales archaeon]